MEEKLPESPPSRPSPPSLLNYNIHYQGNCDTDACGGLIWTGGVGRSPWNKYYKFTCVDSNNTESTASTVFGPVRHFNWQKPKIRLQANGVNPCGNNTLRIYSGTNVNNLSVTNTSNFSMSGDFDGKDAIFVDNK